MSTPLSWRQLDAQAVVVCAHAFLLCPARRATSRSDRPRVMTSAVAHVTQHQKSIIHSASLKPPSIHVARNPLNNASFPETAAIVLVAASPNPFCSQLPRFLFAAFYGRRMDLESDGCTATKIHGFWNRMRTPRHETCFKAPRLRAGTWTSNWLPCQHGDIAAGNQPDATPTEGLPSCLTLV